MRPAILKKGLVALFLALIGLIAEIGVAYAICTISTTSIAFGTYDVLNPAPHDTAGNLVYQCGNRDHDIMITIDRGGGPSFSGRRMIDGTEQLLYNLYLDAARTVIWGDGSGGTQAYFMHNPQKNNQDIALPIYGRIPAGQNVSVGNYSDTLTVTINY